MTAAAGHDDSGVAGDGVPAVAAILRFLTAAEIVETNLWQQYNEIGGIQDSTSLVQAAGNKSKPTA